MKKLKLMLVLLCMSLIMTSFVTALEVPEHYNEGYKYENEYISHIMETTTVFVYTEASAEITYEPININTDRLIDHIIALNAEGYDSDRINEYLITHIIEYLYYGDKITIDSVVGGRGSGVVISEDGYIATNRHVVSFTPEDLNQYHTTTLVNKLINNDMNSVVIKMEALFGEGAITSATIQELKNIFLGAYANRYHISDSTLTTVVSFPGSNGEVSIDDKRTYRAEIVNKGNDTKIEDSAILKIDANNLVALNLTSDYPKKNSRLWASGFPALVDDFMAEASGNDVEISTNITSGGVSKLEEAGNTKLKFIHTDVSMDHGSSGGPAVNDSCLILGLNTFGMNSDGGNFNVIVPAQQIAKLAKDITIGQKAVSKTFLAGIQAMQDGYGATAVECFKAVKKANPDTPYINKLIDDAEKLPQEKVPGSSNFNKIILYGGIGLGLIVLIVVIVIVCVKSSRKNAAAADSSDHTNDIDLSGVGTIDTPEVILSSPTNNHNNNAGDLL